MAKGRKITMVEGDFGIGYPIVVNGASFETEDKLKFTIKENIDGENLIEKEYSNIQNNTFELMFSKEDSIKLTPKTYLYTLDWYREDSFLCNIVNGGELEVENKI